jgi:uncharacterized RmlC-like cupin family protein
MTANNRPRVTRMGHEHGNTAQSGGLKLMTGVGPQHTPATKIWFGKAGNPPGFRSLPHHHGEAETGAYLLSGRACIYFGKDYQEYVEMSEGDFMFVPPFLPHLEANVSTTEELWRLACRSPENIVVNLPDIEDALPGVMTFERSPALLSGRNSIAGTRGLASGFPGIRVDRNIFQA